MESVNKRDLYIDEKVENSIIGAILIEDCMDRAIEYGARMEYFTQATAQDVFNVLDDLNVNGKHIDLVVLHHAIRDKDNVQVLLKYALDCTNEVYTAAHLKEHCAVLEELYLKRETARLGKDLLGASSQMRQDELLKEIEEKTDALKGKKYRNQDNTIGRFVKQAGEDFEKRIGQRERGETAGISTGLKSLDDMLNGWQNGKLNIIAGRPGMGKTAVAVKFALEAAKQGKAVVMYSLEMGGAQLVDRMVLAESDMDAEEYRKGIAYKENMEMFARVQGYLAGLPIVIDDEAVASTAYIRATAKRLKKEGKCDMVIVDYLQLVDMKMRSNQNRENAVASTSREFKIMSKELDVPVLLLSQLSRGVEGRTNKRPMMSDLRESGAIEQDADVIVFVYRPEYYGEEGYVELDARGGFVKGTAELIVAKQREGGTGTVNFDYNRSLTKIKDTEDGREDTVAYCNIGKDYEEGNELPY